MNIVKYREVKTGKLALVKVRRKHNFKSRNHRSLHPKCKTRQHPTVRAADRIMLNNGYVRANQYRPAVT